MSDKSKIEWTDATWNPIRGCSRVSEGCKNCYAERVAARFSKPRMPYAGTITDGRWNGAIRLVDIALEQPLRWRRPRRVFVNSMSDLFHENLSDAVIWRIFNVMRRAPHHTFQVLTKRPGRMLDWFTSIWKTVNAGGFEWPLPNVWLGVSVENQRAADLRIPLLMQTPAAIRFLSIEPILERVSLFGYLSEQTHTDPCPPWHGTYPDWVIVGGESGPGARPMRLEWARSLRDECNHAGVAFFFKQWGEWVQPSQMPVETFRDIEDDGPGVGMADNPLRVGKARAGRELDGITWDEFPTAMEIAGAQ